MFADLKEKAAGFDRKRLYTAVATLVIAGTAGHFMQQSARETGEARPMVAGSVPASASVVAPGILAAPNAPERAEAFSAPAGDIPEAEVRPATDRTADAPIEPDDPQIIPMAEATEPEAIMTEADADVTRSTLAPALGLAAAPATAPEDESIAEILEPVEPAPIVLAALDDAADLVARPDPEPASPLAEACDIAFTAEPRPAAMVALVFEAPCNSGEDLDIEHAGLRFSEQLGPDGSLIITVPGMARKAVFSARLGDGNQTSAEAWLADFDAFERIAVVWKGATGLQLHALENGATYGDPGHVWAERPGTIEPAILGEGGFVSVLGSSANGFAADVYTYPAGLTAEDNGPEISIEAQVMENTCGTRINGEILRSNATGTPNLEPLTIAVPGCDAVGEYLVLKNLPQELKLARN